MLYLAIAALVLGGVWVVLALRRPRVELGEWDVIDGPGIDDAEYATFLAELDALGRERTQATGAAETRPWNCYETF